VSLVTVDSRNVAKHLRSYYDDEGWWALGWIEAYDLTGNTQYLSEAETIFADMNAVFGKANCSQNSGGTGGVSVTDTVLQVKQLTGYRSGGTGRTRMSMRLRMSSSSAPPRLWPTA
jgi:uncharacterized protein YyaL (SSP411 family)